MAPSAKPEIEARRKKVFELYFTLGLSLQQIAAQVGFDVATVSSDLAKMRKEFAQAYELKHEPNEVINREIEKLQLVAEKAWREYHGLREQGLKPHILTPADAKNQATLTRAQIGRAHV